MDFDETEVPEIYILLDPCGAHGLCAIGELNISCNTLLTLLHLIYRCFFKDRWDMC